MGTLFIQLIQLLFQWLVSIQLVSPASGDLILKLLLLKISSLVSIQLVSPASGDYFDGLLKIDKVELDVSIQLVSPASGDVGLTKEEAVKVLSVSIQLVSPASGDTRPGPCASSTSGFHSISFPSEWGQKKMRIIN